MPDETIINFHINNKVTICKKCKYFYGIFEKTYICKAELSPITDFISGFKECEKINRDGYCPQYLNE